MSNEGLWMRIEIDDARCQGHTQCNFTAPDLFGLLEENGHAFARVEQVPEGKQDLAWLAEASCPERAIIVHED